jgi:hypothetical protein
MKPVLFSVDSVGHIQDRLERLKETGSSSTLAIIFSSIVHDLEEIGAIFHQYNIEVFGATSSGEIANTEVHEGSIVAMLLDVSPHAYHLKAFDGQGRTSYEVGQNISLWARAIYENPALIVMSAGLLADGEQVVKGIIETMECRVPLFGGLAGDDLRAQETFVFTSTQILDNGVLALIFDQSTVELTGIAVSGWKGVGTTKTVTKAKGNIVHSIDDLPALDVYHKYLNITAESLHMHAAEYPLQLMRDDGSHVLRSVMVINEDKSMVFAGTVPEGAQAKFSTAPGFEIIDYTIEQMAEFRDQFPVADAIVLFSCAGRNLQLGPMMEEEICSVRKLWNVPLVGLFTYGEIGPMPKGECDFHNQTLVLVLVREKLEPNRSIL